MTRVSSSNQQALGELQGELQLLRQMVEAQQATIATLTANGMDSGQSNSPDPNASPIQQNLKAPTIKAYAGTDKQRNSVSVRGFFYRVQKVGALSNISEEKMLSSPECHSQEKAAAWMMRLEQDGEKPATVSELQSEMIKEFVPSDEITQAKFKLMKLRFKSNMERHISTFEENVQICDTPLSEAYVFVFMGLTPKYREEFIKKYPTGTSKYMREMYEHARTIYMSLAWGKEEKEHDGRPPSKQSHDKESLKKRKETIQNNSLLLWGKARKGEGDIYRKHDRCMKCGNEGWKEEKCTCHKVGGEENQKH